MDNKTVILTEQEVRALLVCNLQFNEAYIAKLSTEEWDNLCEEYLSVQHKLLSSVDQKWADDVLTKQRKIERPE